MPTEAQAVEEGNDLTRSGAVSGNGAVETPETRWPAKVIDETSDVPPAPVDKQPRISLVAIALFCVVLTGLLLRISTAQQLSSHVDESASIMAAKMVAERGAPIFPSGTLYLQGATLSYLLAPMVWIGHGSLDNLSELRMLSVITGTLAILALFFFAKWLTRNQWVALAVAAALAIDPASVRWGGMVRMYATLQLVSIVMLFLFLVLLRSPGSRRLLIAFVLTFWFGVFTHIAICLFLPPMMILTLWKHRWDLLGKRFDLTLALGIACGAPATLLVLNRIVTPPQATPAGTTSGVSFVGDYLLSVEQILHPTLESWKFLFRYGDSGTLVPWLIVALSILFFGRYFLTSDLSPAQRERKNIFSTLMLLYWMPILMVAALATESNERYLLHLQPIGLILVGFGVQELVTVQSRRPSLSFAPATATTVTPVAQVGARLGINLTWLTIPRMLTIAASSIILIGAALRLTGYTKLSLWLDEGFALLYSKQDWASAAGVNGFYSPHPPGYFFATKLFNLVFSDATAGRTLSVLCGVLVLPVFYSLARRLLDPVASVIATLVFALSPIHIYYSQEARMYSMVVLSVTLAFLALVAFLQTNDKWWAAVYGLSLVIAVYADYSSLFVLAPQAAIIGFYAWRDWRKVVPLVIAGGLAILAYLPWLPQVWASVNSANEDERRDVYLGAGLKRILIIVLRITGVSSDSAGAYFPSLEQSPWDRLHELQPVILLMMAPVVLLGFVGLWRRWAPMAIVFSFLGCIVVAVMISLVSPGFAERTILSASVGWALLLGSAFNGKPHRHRTAVAAFSLMAVLMLSLGTIRTIHTSAVKQRWNDASADLAFTSPLGFPVVTYSYGAVADTLVEAYEPGLLDSVPLITIRDGELEKTLSGDNIPQIGITVADVDAGKLNEMLPETPENDLVWYIWAQRVRSENIEAGFERAGYTRIMHYTYDAPRGLVFFDLWARPGADLGTPVPGIQPFTDLTRWGIPADAALVTPSEDGSSVSIQNQSRLGTAVATLVPTSGPALYTINLDIVSRLTGSRSLVTLSCLTDTGVLLHEGSSTTSSPPVNGIRQHMSSVICPDGTEQLRITLRNTGQGEMTFTTPVVYKMPIPEQT